MIPVDPLPEPVTFDGQVRRPGVSFLVRASTPIVWRNHEYWRRALPDLRVAHEGVCCYSSVWIPRNGGQSVDHFIPRALRPALAYEWTNFRFSSRDVNSRKGSTVGVLDPFDIGVHWFGLSFPSLLVVPGPNLPADRADEFQATVTTLGLNHESLIADRMHWLREYCSCDAPLDFLRRNAPFIAVELLRQGLTQSIRTMMRFT